MRKRAGKFDQTLYPPQSGVYGFQSRLDMIWYDMAQYDGTEDKLTGRLKPITYLNHHTIGADSGSRTHTMFPSKDFESFTSAYSITSAYLNIFQTRICQRDGLIVLAIF